MTTKKDTVIRTIILIVALANQVLMINGKSPLPLKDENVTEIISVSFTIITALIAWWKNNSFTKEAIKADGYMVELKNLKK